LKKDFYIYKCLREIHRLKQLQLHEKGNNDILLILNTPGSLEHFMVHTDPGKLKLAFDTLLEHVINTLVRGSIEFGYKLGKDDNLACYVKEPLMPVFSQARFENRFEAEADLLEGITRSLKGLDGNVWINKPQESGKIYWFTVNIQHPASRYNGSSSREDSMPPPDWSDRTVLLVDDVHTNLALLEGILAPTKASVISVDNGLKAVNAVKKNDSIGVVLMDVRMPVLDGYEATRRIKRIKPWLPVIAISAYGSSSESTNWKQAGCDTFLCKPLNSIELIQTMESRYAEVPTRAK
jgi:CheY-like chemotaxis protein